MNKTFRRLKSVALSGILLTLWGCISAPPPPPQQSSADRISALAASLASQLSQSPMVDPKTRIGIVPFTDKTGQGGQVATLCETLRQRLQSELIRRGTFEVIDIGDMDQVLAQYKQQDLIVDALDADTLNQLKGHNAKAIVIGKVLDAQSDFDVECTVTDLTTLVSLASASGSISKSAVLGLPGAYSNPPLEMAQQSLQPLVAPIALYPDPILADILPASTYPDQVQQAGQFIQANPQPTDDQIASQNWDPSVQALAHYPSVVQIMANDPQWTTSLGAAFTTEQPQVMAAIQDLRAQAMATGSLTATPDEAVVQDGTVVYIRPATDVIVVPIYDPVLVYHQRSFIGYGGHYVAGLWLGNGIDWNHRGIYYGDWQGGWVHGPYGWRRDTYWVAPDRRWVRDNRWGPVRYVPPGRYARPRVLEGRTFQLVPVKRVAPARPAFQRTAPTNSPNNQQHPFATPVKPQQGQKQPPAQPQKQQQPPPPPPKKKPAPDQTKS